MIPVEPKILEWFSSDEFLALVNTAAAAEGLSSTLVYNKSRYDSGAHYDVGDTIAGATSTGGIFRSESKATAATRFPFIVAYVEADRIKRLDTAAWQTEVDVTLRVFFGVTEDMDDGLMSAQWADVLREAFLTYCSQRINSIRDGLYFLGATGVTVDATGSAVDDETAGPVTARRSTVTGTVWVAFE